MDGREDNGANERLLIFVYGGLPVEFSALPMHSELVLGLPVFLRPTNLWQGMKSYRTCTRFCPGTHTGRRTPIVHGLGAMGKPQLAIAYAKHRQDNYSAIL